MWDWIGLYLFTSLVCYGFVYSRNPKRELDVVYALLLLVAIPWLALSLVLEFSKSFMSALSPDRKKVI